MVLVPGVEVEAGAGRSRRGNFARIFAFGAMLKRSLEVETGAVEVEVAALSLCSLTLRAS